MTRIVYLAHPVAPTPEQVAAEKAKWGPKFADCNYDFVKIVVRRNLDNARRWLRFFVDHTDWAVAAPWMPYVQTLNDATGAHRERGLRDDCTMAARCDAIVLCGGRVSSGMARERDAVLAAGGASLDLTALGESPPGTFPPGELERLMQISMDSYVPHAEVKR